MEFLDAIGWTSKADDLEKVFAGDAGGPPLPEERPAERAQESTSPRGGRLTPRLESYVKHLEARGGGDKAEAEVGAFAPSAGRGGKGGRQGSPRGGAVMRRRRYGPKSGGRSMNPRG